MSKTDHHLKRQVHADNISQYLLHEMGERTLFATKAATPLEEEAQSEPQDQDENGNLNE